MTLAGDWYTRQSRIAQNTSTAVEGLWSQVDPDRITESWAELIPQATQFVTAGQIAAASQTTDYVSATVREQGARPNPAGRVNPSALAGLTADLLPLESLLLLPAIDAKLRIAGGLTPRDALLGGMTKVITYTGTEVTDAGRLGAQIATTADTTVTGYTRVVNLPACSRCIVLAGRTYKWNAGFQRHPRCDCQHVPFTTTADAVAQGSNALFEQMTRDQQDRAFGRTEAQAIRDGADISQVVNARRGMGYAGQRTTVEGTTKRGAYARRVRARGPVEEVTERGSGSRNVTRVTGRSQRLSVHGIYEQAGDNRELAIELLRDNAYIL